VEPFGNGKIQGQGLAKEWDTNIITPEESLVVESEREKDMSTTSIAHVRLKVKGKPQNVSTFFQLIRSLDWDFPVGNGKIPEDSGKHYEQCEDCGGFVWNGVTLTKDEIERGALQCGVVVKKLFIILSDKCREDHPKVG